MIVTTSSSDKNYLELHDFSHPTQPSTNNFFIYWILNIVLLFSAELIMHRERVDGHCKGVTTTLNQFKTRFHEMVDEHDKEVNSATFSFECSSCFRFLHENLNVTLYYTPVYVLFLSVHPQNFPKWPFNWGWSMNGCWLKVE